MNKQEIEKAVTVLKKYHDLLHEVYADYAVYSKAENYNDKSLELATRANTVKHACDTAITMMEQQLNNGWIPTSERLPEVNGRYITTSQLDKETEVYDLWLENGIWLLDDEDEEYEGDVIAWQPLPEPYKKETNERL